MISSCSYKYMKALQSENYVLQKRKPMAICSKLHKQAKVEQAWFA